jgi:hypothetical protein
MAKPNNHIAQVEFCLKGIPCLIGVIDYSCVKGSYSYHAPSDWDYYGYSDIEWELLDRKGYRAKWLEYKLDDDTNAEIEEAIAKEMNSRH